MTPPYEDLAALRRDARLLDRLAAGNEMLLERDEDPLTDLLAALRDEARTPLPETTLLPVATVGLVVRSGGRSGPSRHARRRRSRAAVGAVAALVSLSLTGVAAAVGGDTILAPIRAAIAQVTGGDEAGSSDPVVVSDSVRDLLVQARSALARGDAAGAAAVLAQARALTAGLDDGDAAALVAQLDSQIDELAASAEAAEDGSAESSGDGTSETGSSSGGGGNGGSSGSTEPGTTTGRTVPPGTAVAPGQDAPPGQTGSEGQDSAPGQGAPPGSQVEPPRTEPTRPETEDSGSSVLDDATTGSATAGSQGRRAQPGGEPSAPGQSGDRGRPKDGG